MLSLFGVSIFSPPAPLTSLLYSSPFTRSRLYFIPLRSRHLRLYSIPLRSRLFVFLRPRPYRSISIGMYTQGVTLLYSCQG